MKPYSLFTFVFFLFVGTMFGQCPDNPPGDQLTSGTDSWIGYVYAETDASTPPSNAFSTTYRGMITANAQFDMDLGVEPLSGPDLCGTYTNNFAIRYRMEKTFTAGFYGFTVGGADGYRLSVDGGITYILSNWTNHPYETTSASVYLDGPVELLLEYYNQNSVTRVSFSYTECTNRSTAPTGILAAEESCVNAPLILTATGGYAAPGAMYEWGTGNSVGANILPGLSSATVTVTPSATTTYWVRRIDAAPCNVTTSGVTATVTVSPVSTVPTAINGSTSVCLGTNTTLTAVGYVGSIQWQSSTDGVVFSDVPGETAPSYSIENVTANLFVRTFIQNGSCEGVYSAPVAITATTPSVSGFVSGGDVVCIGTNSTTLTLSGHVGAVQWQSSTDNTVFTDLAGETNDTLTVIDLTETRFYRARVRNGVCQAVFSNATSIIIKPQALPGTAVATNAFVCPIPNSTTLSLSGFLGTLQWEQSTDGVTYSPIANATSASYTANNLTNTTYFRAAVSNAPCTTVYSNAVLVTVNTLPSLNISGSSAVCAGQNTNILTVSGTADTYQWQSSSDNLLFTDIDGATGTSYTATNIPVMTFYRVRATNGPCEWFSPIFNVSAVASPNAGTVSGQTTVCASTNSTTLTLTGSNGSIQWQSSADAVTFTDISGAVASTFTAINISATTHYRAMISNGICPPVYSNVATLTYSAAVAGTISGGGTICQGGVATLTVTGSNGNIQWQSSSNNLNFTNITGATNPIYLAVGLTANTYFRARISGGSCGTAFSPSTLVTVVSGIPTGVISAPGTNSNTALGIVSGSNNTVMTLTGASGMYQWQSSTDNLVFTDIPGATSTTYTAVNLTATTYYRVAISQGGCVVYCPVFALTLCGIPAGDPSTYGTNGNWRIYMYAEHEGANPPADPFNASLFKGWTNSVGIENFDFTMGNIGVINGTGTICGANWGFKNKAYRYRLTKNFAASTYIFRVGSNGGYRLSVDGGATWIINQWNSTGTYNATSSAPVSLSGNVNLVIEYFNLATYNARHTFNSCDQASATAIPNIVGPDTMCLNTNATLGISFAYGLSCQWGTGTTAGQNAISGATGNLIAVSPTQTTTYWVRRFNPVCNTYGQAAFKTITVNPAVPVPSDMPYGNEKWIGYVYASKTFTNATTPALAFGSSYAYAGYVTTTSDTFSYTAYGPGSITTVPTQFLTSTLCGYFERSFSVRYKMTKNFTAGYYTFTVAGNDRFRLSLDGGATWVVQSWPTGGAPVITPSVTYSTYLSGSKDLVLEFNQHADTYVLSFSYVACTNLSTPPTTISGTTTICSGNSTTLTASGGTHVTGSTYEWGTGSVIGENVLTTSAATLTVSPTTTTTYWVRRKNAPACAQTSGSATTPIYTTGITTTVTVAGANAVAGTITGGGVSVCGGTNSTVLTLTGSLGTIQWQTSTNNTNWTNIPGATAAIYTATNLTTNTYYRVVVNNGSCSAATSSSVNILVLPASIASTVTGGGSVCAGQNSATLSATGYSGSVQWQSSADNVTFTDITGATGAALNVFNLSATTYYRIAVTNGSCPAVTSSSVAVTVNPLSVAGVASGNNTVCSGINSSTLTLTGYLGDVQWQSSSDNVTFANIPSATGPSYTATNLTATTYYRAIITNGACLSVTSNAVVVIVNPSPLPGTITGGGTVCFGNNATTLTLTGNTDSIQWQSSTDNVNFTSIPFATSPSLTVYNLVTTTYYRVVLSNGICTSTSQESEAIQVDPLSVAGSIQGSTTVCSGTNAQLLLTGSVGTIQWQSSTDDEVFTDIPGANTPVLTTANLEETTFYRAIITSGICSSSTTTSAVVYVRPSSVPGTASGGATVCAGINATPLTLTGYVGNIQWQSSTDNINFTNLSGATSDVYTAVNLTGTRFYRAIVTTNLCSSTLSNTVEVTVLPFPTAGTISISGTTLSTISVCSGSNSTLLNLVGSAGSPQWQSSPDNITYSDIDGATSSSLTLTNVTATTYYRAVISSNLCGASQTSSPILIKIPPVVTYNGFWSGIPSATTDVVVASNYVLANNLSVCSCQVGAGAQVTIPSGRTLQVQRDITVDPAGSLTVENTGSILQIDDTAINSGSITYKRNTMPLKQDDYTYYSSPVAGQTLGGVASPSFHYSFDTLSNTWVGETPITFMVPGKGYIVRAPDNLDYTSPQILTTFFMGTPINGLVTAPISKAGDNKYNLIGNPYPSAIDIDRFILDPANTNLINGTIYLWSHNTAISADNPGPDTLNYNGSDYAKYNLTGGVSTANPALTGGNIPTGKIAAGQGFFIEANDNLADGTYPAVFSNRMRIIGQNTQFFRTAALMQTPTASDKNRFWLGISNAAGLYNQTLVGYVDGATNGFDTKFDGRVYSAGNPVSLYSLLLPERLCIQGRALPFDTSEIIPLGYTALVAGDFQIALDAYDGLFEGQDIFLHDIELDTYHNLKTAPYSFTTEAGTFEERFEIRFNAPLSNEDFETAPVRISYFDGAIRIASDTSSIESVVIFDLLGKRLFTETDMVSTSLEIPRLPVANQMVIVKVVLDNGQEYHKKIAL